MLVSTGIGSHAASDTSRADAVARVPVDRAPVRQGAAAGAGVPGGAPAGAGALRAILHVHALLQAGPSAYNYQPHDLLLASIQLPREWF